MGACESYCTQELSSRCIHGMIDVIENANFFQNTISPQKVSSYIYFSGLVGQPVAQGALELNCSFLQLKHNRTSLL